MKTLFTLIAISICSTGFGQSKEVPKDSLISFPLSEWHQFQFKSADQEIKRLQATTIEAEIQRVSDRKSDILTSFLAGKVPFEKIIPGSVRIEGDKVVMKVTITKTK